MKLTADVNNKRKKQILAILIILAVLINIINISISLFTKENTAPHLSEAANTCNEDCSLTDKDGRLYSCTPPDGDGTTRDLECNTAGKIETCGNEKYCCPKVEGKWTKDMTACITPTPTPILSATPIPTVENKIKADFDESGRVDIRDFVIFAEYYKDEDLKGDLNGDSSLDIRDFEVFRGEYLKYNN